MTQPLDEPLDKRQVQLCITALRRSGSVIAWDDAIQHWLLRRQLADWIENQLSLNGEKHDMPTKHVEADARGGVVYVRTKRGWLWVDNDGNSSSWFPRRTEAERHYQREYEPVIPDQEADDRLG